MESFLRLKGTQIENMGDAFTCAQSDDNVIAAPLSHAHIGCWSGWPDLGRPLPAINAAQ
jgi:hypothetical protein